MSFRDDLYDIRVWLSEEDLERLERLMKRYGCSRSAVISAALEIYENAVNVLDSNPRGGGEVDGI